MNIEPSTNQSVLSDDQELAKVLAGITQQAEEQALPADNTPMTAAPADDTAAPAAAEETASTPDFIMPPVPEQAANSSVAPSPESAIPAQNSDLETIKQDALKELRPLVDKLDVSPEEKFDTYLLLLRSTDDAKLIAPAFAAARGIADETRRAQALLDTIKEIDYLSDAKTATV